jgi:hypothetical protein
VELTQVELDQIKKQVRYEPDTGRFYYLTDRYVERRFPAEMAAPKAPKLVHSAGDQADKIYGRRKQYVGVYVMLRGEGRVINAAHLALYLVTGHWPEAVRYRSGDWGDMTASNLEPRTRSQQTTDAATARYEGSGRKLPPNVYGTSAGWFVGKKGNQKTKEFESVREVLQAIRLNRWLS